MKKAPSLHIKGRAQIGETPIFDALDLTVAAGQWTCLLGPSGVGKSTVLRLFAGLGEGIDFTGDFTDASGQVALMAQDDLLMPWLTVQGNVTLGAKLRGETPDANRAKRVLDRVGLSGKADRKASELSGGQRQRVALARTLMEDRPIVLLDEPFSALDAKTRASMQELTAELLAGKTVLLVTHDPAEAARLGHTIHIMSANGTTPIAPPKGDVPRPMDDPDVLQAQAALLKILREDD